MDMIFRKEYTVHTYETDTRGLARPVALLNYLQDSAGDHAGRLGLSVTDLVKRGLTWVLSRYHIVFHRYPALGERVEVMTWPSGKHGYFAIRDFEVSDGNGGPLLAATSSWMVIGLKDKHTVKVEDVVGAAYAVEKRALKDSFAPLSVPTKRESEVRFRVETGHLDWNRHVNNAVYVQWALEGLPLDILMNRRPTEIEVSYRAEALYGDEVLSVVQRIQDGGPGPAFLHQILNGATGAELTRLRTQWS